MTTFGSGVFGYGLFGGASIFPTLTVELDTGNPSAGSPTWVDITDYVMEIQTRRGRQYELDAIEAGTATITLDNSDRRFDPTYTHGPYYPNVVPMRRIRVSATYSSTTYRIFTGYVEAWPPKAEGLDYQTVTVPCVDAFYVLAQTIITGTFGSATSGSRIGAVLTAVSSSFATSLDTGVTTVPAVTFAASDAEDALSHIKDVVDAELGLFFANGAGTLIFQDRNHRTMTTTSVVTFTNSAAATDSLHVNFEDIAPSYDLEHLINSVSVTASGTGGTSTAIDSSSQTKYLTRSLVKSALLSTDSEALDHARYIVYQHSEVKLRFDEIIVDAHFDDNLWAHVLGREISDRVTVSWTPPSTPDVAAQTITQDVFIESISSDITPLGRDSTTVPRWETTYQLSPSLPSDFWVFDTSTFDTNTTFSY